MPTPQPRVRNRHTRAALRRSACRAPIAQEFASRARHPATSPLGSATVRLEKLLVELSVWAWDFLDDAERAGFSPREDTITEHLLVELVRRAPGQAVVRKTT